MEDLRNEHVLPQRIAAVLDAMTSKQWRDWLPETLAHYCKADGVAHDKIMATQVICTNADVVDEWPLLCAVSSALQGRGANFDWLDKPSYLELAWAFTVIGELSPRFVNTPQMTAFLQAILAEEGLIWFPWSNPAVTAEGCDSSEIAKLWNGGLKDTTLSDIDEKNPLEVQAAKLVAAQTFIRRIRELGA